MTISIETEIRNLHRQPTRFFHETEGFAALKRHPIFRLLRVCRSYHLLILSLFHTGKDHGHLLIIDPAESVDAVVKSSNFLHYPHT
jgi:hypothetical protein